ILFYKIWKNILIRKVIFEHLALFKLYNISYLNLNSEPFLNHLLSNENYYYCKSFVINNSSFLNDIPNDIDKLNIKPYFISTQMDKRNVLPSSLITLKIIGSCIIYNNSIPDSVQFLSFEDFNIKFANEHFLPSNLKTISFGQLYNKPFNSRTFKKCTQLKSIYLGRDYNQVIEPNTFPNSLEELNFSEDSLFNQPLKFNYTLKYLQFKDLVHYGGNLMSIYTIPSSLETLVFGEVYEASYIGFIRSLKNLKTLKIGKIYH
ncbi:hypothetical protein DICPUDRAFT_20862, partial [Dictyostelium purpureum]